MYALVRPLLFLLPPHAAHALGMAGLWPLEHSPRLRAMTRAFLAPRDPRLVVKTSGLTFPSPVGLAGGFDKNAARLRALAALGFGHLEAGTLTAEAQQENPRPNLFRLPRDHALVNRLGFPNPGAETVARHLLATVGEAERRHAAEDLGVPLGVSIGKSRSVGIEPVEGAIEDYLASYAAVEKVADFVVVNVSSPNTKDLRAMQGPKLARELLDALTRARRAGARPKLPIFLKIAPDLSDADIEALLLVVDEAGLDGVVATNTTTARTGLATRAKRVERIGAGGLSGAPLRARALHVVRRVRARLGPSRTVIGVGGVERTEHAVALLEAGADLVQMYTGFVYGGPLAPWSITRGILRVLERRGLTSVGNLGEATRSDPALPP